MCGWLVNKKIFGLGNRRSPDDRRSRESVSVARSVQEREKQQEN